MCSIDPLCRLYIHTSDLLESHGCKDQNNAINIVLITHNSWRVANVNLQLLHISVKSTKARPIYILNHNTTISTHALLFLFTEHDSRSFFIDYYFYFNSSYIYYRQADTPVDMLASDQDSYVNVEQFQDPKSVKPVFLYYKKCCSHPELMASTYCKLPVSV